MAKIIPRGVAMELSDDEARALKTLIGGSSESERRQISDVDKVQDRLLVGIWEVLAGVTRSED
jgi:hypothetical protein